MRCYRYYLVCCLVCASFAQALLVAPVCRGEEQGKENGAPLGAFKIFLVDPGVYRLRYEDLTACGVDPGPLPSARMEVANSGRQVPIRVIDGEDGLFGPGDWLELVGEHLPGDKGYLNEYSPVNIYVLRWDADTNPVRMIPTARQPPPEESACKTLYTAQQHHEEDRILLRFADRDPDRELWFWAKISPLNKHGFRLDLDLPALDTSSDRLLEVRVQLQGWSHQQKRTELADHHADLYFGEELIGSAEWNRQEATLLTAQIPASELQPRPGEKNQLVIKVPLRSPEGTDDPLIDMVLLNWIEVVYPRHEGVGRQQSRLELEQACPDQLLRLYTPDEEQLVVYSDDGVVVTGLEMRRQVLANGGVFYTFCEPWQEEPVAGRSLYAVADGKLATPVAVEPSFAAGLKDGDNRADYLIIAHPTLIDAVRPLADFHRQRGLQVRLVDINSVYDEFNSSIPHPRAIRDFLSHAYRYWSPPAPRFVLLVGDASWDISPEDSFYVFLTYSPFRPEVMGFLRTDNTPYEETPAEVGNRNLIPTWSYLTSEGRAASDNYFVSFATEADSGSGAPADLPKMAIGRLPVVAPQEVADIVKKTIAYARSSELGEWRRRIMWIGDGESHLNRMSDRLAETFAGEGYAAMKVHPLKSDPDNEQHRQRLIEAFDQGQLLVHFVGHGGRYIWRTAPADFEKNRDLFTLENVDQLQPNTRLPIIIAMTCYSAPFDHPTSDSIGEKFLRVADRGAVAVIAASWRISPNHRVSDMLLRELMKPTTVGEAVMRTKQQSGHQHFLHIFNLLGDPALPIAVPTLQVDLKLQPSDPGAVEVSISAEESFTGDATFDWLSADSTVVETQELPVAGTSVQARFSGGEKLLATVELVQVYVRSQQLGTDGIAAVRMPHEQPQPITEIPASEPEHPAADPRGVPE